MVNSLPQEQMDLLAAAKRLRTVRTACRRFLMLWAMSPAAKDSASEAPLDDAVNDPDALLRALADPRNRNWSLLYRGSVLDD